jgi:hypothetical protein
MRLEQQEESSGGGTAAAATRADAIAQAIARRRKAAGDDYLEGLSTDAFGAVRYVCSHTAGVSRAVVAADVIDALAVVRELREALDRHELGLMLIGRRVNLTWRAMADALGMSSRQAGQQRYQRLDAGQQRYQELEDGITGNRRSEVAARAISRGRTAEERWFARNRGAVEELAEILASASYDSPAARDDAESLAEILADPERPTGSLLAWIGQVLEGLERAGEVPDGLGALLEDAGRLVGEWRRVRPPVP